MKHEPLPLGLALLLCLGLLALVILADHTLPDATPQPPRTVGGHWHDPYVQHPAFLSCGQQATPPVGSTTPMQDMWAQTKRCIDRSR